MFTFGCSRNNYFKITRFFKSATNIYILGGGGSREILQTVTKTEFQLKILHVLKTLTTKPIGYEGIWTN